MFPEPGLRTGTEQVGGFGAVEEKAAPSAGIPGTGGEKDHPTELIKAEGSRTVGAPLFLLTAHAQEEPKEQEEDNQKGGTFGATQKGSGVSEGLPGESGVHTKGFDRGDRHRGVHREWGSWGGWVHGPPEEANGDHLLWDILPPFGAGVETFCDISGGRADGVIPPPEFGGEPRVPTLAKGKGSWQTPRGDRHSWVVAQFLDPRTPRR
jgi:hypothetical protein